MNLTQIFEPGAAFIVIIAVCMVGLTDFRSVAALYGVQSLAVGVLAIIVGNFRGEALLVLVGCAIIVLKGIAVPLYLRASARRIGCRRDGDMIVAAPLQLFLALGGLSILFLLRPLGDELPRTALPALAILLLGIMLMITHRLAVSQIVGFLVIENGIFLYTIAQPHSMPILVEIGVLMDVLSATMLAGFLAFRISRSFEHIGVADVLETLP